MEEIRGTEALEREILEDARKRADRIIRKAEENARLLGAQTEQRIKEAISALLSEYRIKKRTAELEMLSRLPLEKARLDILYRDEILRKALQEVLASMNPRLFGLWCVKRLACQVDLVRKSPAKVLVHGLDSETMRDIGALFRQGSSISEDGQNSVMGSDSGQVLGAGQDSGMRQDSELRQDSGQLLRTGPNSDISIEEAPAMKVRGLIVEPMDTSYRISITENELLEWLLDEKRGELAAALFGSST